MGKKKAGCLLSKKHVRSTTEGQSPSGKKGKGGAPGCWEGEGHRGKKGPGGKRRIGPFRRKKEKGTLALRAAAKTSILPEGGGGGEKDAGSKRPAEGERPKHGEGVFAGDLFSKKTVPSSEKGWDTIHLHGTF